MTDVYRELREAVEPGVVSDMTRYLRRLIVEAPYIRARLTNPGGSVVLMPSSNPDQISYNPNIGNDAHLDLITAEMLLDKEFSQGERDTIKDWAQGFTSAQAAEYNLVKNGAVIRKRRERVFEKLEHRLTDGRAFDIGGPSDGIAEGGVTAIGDQPAQAGHTGRETPETSEQARSEPRGNTGKDEEA